MPAMKSRSGQKNGAQSTKQQCNGLSNDLDEQMALKQKRLLLDSDNENNNNNNNNDNEFLEEQFADLRTIGAKSTDEPPIIIRRDEDEEGQSSIGRTARDQFAVALLRLQSDLEASNRRLNELEGKLESAANNRRSASSLASNSKGGGGGGGSNLLSCLVYLSWPVVVFVAMRAIERRSSSGKLAG